MDRKQPLQIAQRLQSRAMQLATKLRQEKDPVQALKLSAAINVVAIASALGDSGAATRLLTMARNLASD